MDVIEGILLRKSVKAFKSGPVSRKLLEDTLETVLLAPSWGVFNPVSLSYWVEKNCGE
jgi:hypothetical protein